MLRPDKRRLYAPVKSTLKHPPQAYPGHLMSFAAREGGNLINLVFLGTGIWSLLIGAISFPDLLWTKPKGRSGQIQFALRDRCFHETKQTQNEVKRYLLQLGRICFRILLQQSENFSDFCKVLSQFAFRNMIIPFYMSSSACALKLPSISHTSFLMQKVFTNPPPSPNCYRQISLNTSGISSRHLVFMWRLGDLVSTKKGVNRGRGL